MRVLVAAALVAVDFALTWTCIMVTASVLLAGPAVVLLAGVVFLTRVF